MLQTSRQSVFLQLLLPLLQYLPDYAISLLNAVKQVKVCVCKPSVSDMKCISNAPTAVYKCTKIHCCLCFIMCSKGASFTANNEGIKKENMPLDMHIETHLINSSQVKGEYLFLYPASCWFKKALKSDF